MQSEISKLSCSDILQAKPDTYFGNVQVTGNSVYLMQHLSNMPPWHSDNAPSLHFTNAKKIRDACIQGIMHADFAIVPHILQNNCILNVTYNVAKNEMEICTICQAQDTIASVFKNSPVRLPTTIGLKSVTIMISAIVTVKMEFAAPETIPFPVMGLKTRVTLNGVTVNRYCSEAECIEAEKCTFHMQEHDIVANLAIYKYQTVICGEKIVGSHDALMQLVNAKHMARIEACVNQDYSIYIKFEQVANLAREYLQELSRDWYNIVGQANEDLLCSLQVVHNKQN